MSNEVKSYKHCCNCRYFFDNEKETRFECEKEIQDENCYECEYSWGIKDEEN